MCCLFILLCCRSRPVEDGYAYQYKNLDSAKALVHTGDLIVRNGTDEVSFATRKFNRKDTSYSHCGLIQVENDSIWVYHALGGIYNPSQTLKRQIIDSFCNPMEIDQFAIYRYKFSTAQNQLLSRVVTNYYKEKLPFDMFFNIESNDKMYCSEFVFKSINAVTNGYLMNRLPYTQPQYVTVDDLYLNPLTQLVIKVRLRSGDDEMN